MTPARTPAIGGTREVPVPDPVAREYLLLGLRLDQHLPGTVDGYYGPADLKARVDLEQLAPPGRLADEAAALRARLPAEVGDPDRRAWLDLQLRALETLAQVRAGRELPYLDEVERCFAHRPVRRPDERLEAAGAELDRLLPGSGPLADRLDEHDRAWTIPPDRVAGVAGLLVDRFRGHAARLFGLPDGEAVRVSMARGQPWTGYNWYDGGYRSRVDLNLDLPIRLPSLVATVAHETYPGHHLEHATKEQVLVEEGRRLEASILLINTPECLISEGLAEAGRAFAVPPASLPDVLCELAPVAGLALAADPAALREAAGLARTVAAPRATLDASRLNAAILLHQDGWPRARVREYLIEVGRFAPDRADKALEFLVHPLWRLYDHVYAEGEAMVSRWLDAAPEAARPARFGRLLREQLTPPAIEERVANPAADGR